MLLGATDTTSDSITDSITADSTGDTPSNTIPTLPTEPYSDSVTTAPRGDPGNSITRDRPGRRKLVRKNQPSRPQRDLLPPPLGASQPSHSQRSQFRSSRTRHQAVDRMLSTLLVEIDGIYTTSSSPHSNNSNSSSSSSGRSSSQVRNMWMYTLCSTIRYSVYMVYTVYCVCIIYNMIPHHLLPSFCCMIISDCLTVYVPLYRPPPPCWVHPACWWSPPPLLWPAWTGRCSYTVFPSAILIM